MTHVVGDVKGRPCLIVDDIIATGGTVEQAVTALLAAGARPEIVIAATHGLLVDGERDRLSHPSVRDVFVTDTVAVVQEGWRHLRVVSISSLIAGALERFLADGSIGDLY